MFVFCFFRGCSASGFRILRAFAIQTFRSHSIMRGLPGSAGFLGPGQAGIQIVANIYSSVLFSASGNNVKFFPLLYCAWIVVSCSLVQDDPPTGVPFLLGAVAFAAVGEPLLNLAQYW